MDQPRGHRREALVAMCPTPNVAISYMFVGCGGTAPSPSLELLSVATAMVSSLRDPRKARVPYEAVAPGDPCDSTGGGPLYFFSDLLVAHGVHARPEGRQKAGSGIDPPVLEHLDQCASHDDPVGNRGNLAGLLRSGDPEPDGNR